MSNNEKENIKKEIIKGDAWNWDNNFSVRFKLDNDKQLKHIPNNIFILEMPELVISDMAELDSDKFLKLTLKSTKEGLVEKEVFDILMRTPFDMEVSLSNPNQVDFEYNGCSVEKILYAPLIHRPKANPYNFTVQINISQIKVHNANDTVVIGEILGESAFEIDSLVLAEKQNEGEIDG